MFSRFGNAPLVFLIADPRSQTRAPSFALYLLAITFGMLTAQIHAEVLSLAGQTMGTTFSVKVVASGNQFPNDLKRQIEQRLAEIDASMSTWRDDSEVSRFNAFDSTNDWFDISDDTHRVIRLALDISKETGGAFDITAAPIISLWSFGANSRGKFVPPSDSEIASTLAVVGYDKIELQAEPPRIRKSVSGLQIDLSAIAKGFAVDEIARLLDEDGRAQYMVEIGGEVVVSGKREDNTAWQIGIEAPIRNTRELALAVPLVDTAIASSGDYRNFFEFEGQFFSHIIDSRSGRPADGDLAAISVLSDDCATADAIATAMLVLGADAARQWCQDHDISALLFKREGSGFSRFSTHEFPAESATSAQHENGFLTILLASGIVFSFAFAALAIGAILKGKCLQGSCGGLANLSGKVGGSLCETCDRRIRNECDSESRPPTVS